MAPTVPAVWQVSAGPASRSYADLLLRHGVALIGPGDSGPWKPEQDDAEFDGSFVRRFAAELQDGDVLLLRTGMSKIRAVGLVAGGYTYLSQFDDVNGWDLQHARRLRWQELPSEYDFGVPVFGANPPRFSKVHAPQVVDYAGRFINSPPSDWQLAPLPGLPVEEQELVQVPLALRAVTAEVDDLLLLLDDDVRFREQPTEDELLVHIVVPLLKALGWPPERIAVKWRYVDVCLFHSLPRQPDNIAFIIEAKRLGAGVEGALNQGKRYLDTLGVVRDIVVTDGIRYRLYAGDDGFRPVAYANLARLKQAATKLFERIKRQ